MKTLTQTIIVILALSLFAAGVVSARNASDEEILAAAVELQAQKAQLEQSKAELAAARQAQISQPAAPVLPTTPTPVSPSTVVATVEKNIYELTDALSFGTQAGRGQ